MITRSRLIASFLIAGGLFLIQAPNINAMANSEKATIENLISITDNLNHKIVSFAQQIETTQPLLEQLIEKIGLLQGHSLDETTTAPYIAKISQLIISFNLFGSNLEVYSGMIHSLNFTTPGGHVITSDSDKSSLIIQANAILFQVNKTEVAIETAITEVKDIIAELDGIILSLQ